MTTMHSISRVTLLAVMVLVWGPAHRAFAQPEALSTDDEVMQPTKHGFRLTPEMARVLSRVAFRNDEDTKELGLTPEQEGQLADAMARRLIQLGHSHGKHLQPFLECFIESMIIHQGKFPVDDAQRFGELAGPVMPGVKELMNGLSEDARDILDADQFADFDKDIREGSQGIERFENKMKRWAEGRANDGEDFDHYEPEDGEAPESEPKEPKNKKVRHAEAMAQWEINRAGSWKWRRFLNGVKYFFKFDDEQVEKAEKLLADHRRRADAVMTETWKKKVRVNRTQYHLHRSLVDDMPVEPWLYHLEREYEEARAPIKELGQAFREAVLALVTDEQREAALAGIRERAARHGLAAETLKIIEVPLVAPEKEREAEPATQNGGDG